jgi:hypothetical protein
MYGGVVDGACGFPRREKCTDSDVVRLDNLLVEKVCQEHQPLKRRDLRSVEKNTGCRRCRYALLARAREWKRAGIINGEIYFPLLYVKPPRVGALVSIREHAVEMKTCNDAFWWREYCHIMRKIWFEHYCLTAILWRRLV